jgi:hypothetical protein
VAETAPVEQAFQGWRVDHPFASRSTFYAAWVAALRWYQIEAVVDAGRRVTAAERKSENLTMARDIAGWTARRSSDAAPGGAS